MFGAEDKAASCAVGSACNGGTALNRTCITHSTACNFRSVSAEVAITPTSPLDLELLL